MRADATETIGTGHVMRCLALAQNWRSQGGSAVLLSYTDSSRIRQHVESSGIRFIPMEKSHPHCSDLKRMLDELKQIEKGRSDPWVVVDGYHFDSEYHKDLRSAGCRLLVVDDINHLDHYIAELLLNQNIDADKIDYPCEPETRQLLGPRFVMLRPEFQKWRQVRRSVPEKARNVLITLGGGDSNKQTSKMVQALDHKEFRELEFVVVLGHSNPETKQVQFAIEASDLSIRLIESASNMPELMAWADMAVTAGGSTCWEMAYMGVPLLILTTATNQFSVAAGLCKRDISYSLGWWHEVSKSKIRQAVGALVNDKVRRSKMSTMGRELVDGKGTERIIEEMAR